MRCERVPFLDAGMQHSLGNRIEMLFFLPRASRCASCSRRMHINGSDLPIDRHIQSIKDVHIVNRMRGHIVTTPEAMLGPTAPTDGDWHRGIVAARDDRAGCAPVPGCWCQRTENDAMGEFDTDIAIPRYAASLDFDALWREFPPADVYFRIRSALAGRTGTRVIQSERFAAPHSRERPAGAVLQADRGLRGLEPGPSCSVDDLSAHRILFGCTTCGRVWSKNVGIDPLTTSPCH